MIQLFDLRKETKRERERITRDTCLLVLYQGKKRAKERKRKKERGRWK